MDDYSIENLCKVFLEHSKEFEIEQEKNRKNFPDSILFDNEFNISKALHVICEELRKLQNER